VTRRLSKFQAPCDGKYQAMRVDYVCASLGATVRVITRYQWHPVRDYTGNARNPSAGAGEPRSSFLPSFLPSRSCEIPPTALSISRNAKVIKTIGAFQGSDENFGRTPRLDMRERLKLLKLATLLRSPRARCSIPAPFCRRQTFRGARAAPFRSNE